MNFGSKSEYKSAQQQKTEAKEAVRCYLFYVGSGFTLEHSHPHWGSIEGSSLADPILEKMGFKITSKSRIYDSFHKTDETSYRVELGTGNLETAISDADSIIDKISDSLLDIHGERDGWDLARKARENILLEIHLLID